jgi:Tfp pilus assembly protein PilO
MTRGIPWTTQQETELKTLIEKQTPLDTIAIKLGKKPGAIIIKCKRLGLEPTLTKGTNFTGYVSIPKDLPSVEEAIRMLAGALKTAVKPGLTKLEVQRLQAVANIAKTYKELVTDYARYNQIEAKLIEMETKYENLLQQQKTTQNEPNPTPN